MKNVTLKIGILALMIAALSSCTTFKHSMREPNTLVNLEKSDFTLSDQVSAEASTTKIFGIDFARLFTKKLGSSQGGALAIDLASIPVIGNYMYDKTANYSLYNLMSDNPGYDVVFYPQYETKISRPLGFKFIVTTTTVKTTARLGKLNK